MDLARYSAPTLGAFRIVVGFFFACHGAATLFGLFGKTAADVGAWPGWWGGLIQFVCGTLVMLGLFTTPAAILASGSMAYAYFVHHQPDALLPLNNKGELAAMFCWSFFLLAILGPGAFALDQLWRKRATTAK